METFFLVVTITSTFILLNFQICSCKPEGDKIAIKSNNNGHKNVTQRGLGALGAGALAGLGALGAWEIPALAAVVLPGLGLIGASILQSQQQKPRTTRKPSKCYSVPHIKNGKMQHCQGTKAGDTCIVKCKEDYQPTKKSVLCSAGFNPPRWKLNGAECKKTKNPVCIDDSNSPIDWFVAYRMPKSVIENKYLFISSNNPNFQAIAPNALENTLTAADSARHSTSGTIKYIFYNDGEPPELDTRNAKVFGHAKGVLVFDAETEKGFYMIHTLPKYPADPLIFQTKHSDKFAQIFMCITISSWRSFNGVVGHLSNLKPNVYDSNISLQMVGTTLISPEFAPVPDQAIEELTGLRKITIKSEKGTPFDLFSKTKLGTDIYLQISGLYQTNSFVQTWQSGRGGKLHSQVTCGNWVENVNNFSYKYEWKATQDHSKWLVSQGENDLFCVGDLNRMKSQMNRFGGAVCMENVNVALAFRRLVNRESVTTTRPTHDTL